MKKYLLPLLPLLTMPMLPAQEDYSLVWSDEFNTPGLPDPTKWKYDVGGGGWGNNELQYYTEDRLENARVEDGHLIIEAIREPYQNRQYTSARLVSTGEGNWLYGRFEIRAMLPSGRGTWPAVWMLPTDWVYGGWPRSGEIDIMEHVGYDMNRVHATIHTEDFNHLRGTQVGQSILLENVDTQFHTYAMEWRPDRIEAFVDGVRYFSVDNNGSGVGAWPFDQRFHLLLNIAVGGNWGGVQGVDESIFPQRMVIDYVRVYELHNLDIELPEHDVPGRIRLEAFAAQSGVRLESTEDTGSGSNLAYLNDNDWSEYTINVPAAGTYALQLRFASPTGTGAVTFSGPDGLNLRSPTLPATGGWQNWQTADLGEVTLPAGQSTLRLTYHIPGQDDLNVNWIELEATGSTPDPDPVTGLWRGYPAISQNTVLADGWLGYLLVDKAPWVWSYALSHWLYIPLSSDTGRGSWVYIP